MRDIVVDNLGKRFGFYADLIADTDEATINAAMDVPRHRSLGMHLWCIVGARESYAKAIEAGAMQRWSSSVTKFEPEEFTAKLASSAQALQDAIDAVEDWTPERERLLADIAEHEVMHEGQIIRLMFGLEKPLPESCHWAVCS